MVVAAFATPARSQSAQATTDGALPVGYPMTYYGLSEPASQRVSVRAVLQNLGQDQAYARAGVVATTAYVFLTLFAGGSGAAVDVVTARPDLVK